MSDLEELFSRLKTQQQPQARHNASDPRTANIVRENQSPAVAAASIPQTPTRQIMPRGATEQNMSNNLLNLLNINRPTTTATPTRAVSAAPASQSNGSSFDPTIILRQPSESAAFPPRLTTGEQPSEPPAGTQKFLLDLLTKPAKPSERAQTAKTPDLKHTDQSTTDKLAYSLSVKPAAQSTTAKAATPRLEAPQSGKAGLFNYVNPFDQLRASSPMNGPSSNPPPADHAADKVSLSVAQKLEHIGETVGKRADEALAQATKSKDEDITSNWSTAEDEDTKKEQDEEVETFAFVMKPFVMLELQQGHAVRTFRNSTWTNATPVARLKKEFSHDDRTLATASQSYIVYAVVPTEKKPASGLKVIRQDDGKNKHIWSGSNERLCSVQISSTASDVVLATGVNGTIFYAELPAGAGHVFDETNVETHGFIMTPPPNCDEPTAGGFATSAAIRTRAKLSNRNPNAYFAVARGRQIHFFVPALVRRADYRDAATQRVDTDKLLSETSFSINTGKAGKDFCFSEDDSILASLDKLGKVKFWDIRTLTTDVDSFVDKPSKTEIKESIFSFAAGVNLSKPDDKMSPSSITFLDKERAYAKNVALRYVLIGYQQNHILQLWDLGLCKCVQELRFPESISSPEDAAAKGMCSVTYHPKTCVICVGHPGRNSIYLLHLSAPKYNLPPMDQATYLSYLARGDRKNVPLPESTAIMSGIREFSCSRVGQLRSLDILKAPFQSESSTQSSDDETLFEIYLMHSKGVVGIPLVRAELGMDIKGKHLKPVDAVQRGVVIVRDLVAFQTEEKSAPAPPSVKPSTKPPQASLSTKAVNKPKKEGELTVEKPTLQQAILTDPVVSKDSSRRKPVQAESPARQSSNAIPMTGAVSKDGLASQASKINQSIITPESYKMTDPPRESSPSSEHDKGMNGEASTSSTTISAQFDSLYAKLDADRRIAEAAGAAKQDAMLRLVSSTLTDNVEASLHKIVSASIEQQVLPALTSHVNKSISQGLQHSLPDLHQQVKASIPGAIDAGLKSALQDPAFVRTIATETIKQLDDKVKSTVQTELRRSHGDLLTKMEAQHAEIKSLLKQARGEESTLLADTRQALQNSEERITQLLSTIQREQSQLSARIDSLQQPVEPGTPQTVQITKDEPSEVQHLTQLLNNGDYEQATLEWLQSSQQTQLFDDLFVRINPEYLQQVSPLIRLSVSAAVTSSFDTNVAKRLEWLSWVLDGMDVKHPEIRDVIPKIMDVLIQRLQGAYMQIAESRPTDQQVLRKLATLNRVIGDIRGGLS